MQTKSKEPMQCSYRHIPGTKYMVLASTNTNYPGREESGRENLGHAAQELPAALSKVRPYPLSKVQPMC